MKKIGTYYATDLQYLETRRGLAYTAKIQKGEKVVGTIENQGIGGSTDVSVEKEEYADFKKTGLAYFETIGFNTERLEDYNFQQTIAEHLMQLAENGEVDTETLSNEWLS